MISEEENSIAIVERELTPNLNKVDNKKIGLKSRLKKKNQGPNFLKGFAHGFG